MPEVQPLSLQNHAPLPEVKHVQTMGYRLNDQKIGENNIINIGTGIGHNVQDIIKIILYIISIS